MPRIAISYRRDDSAGITGRIFDRLIAQYGSDPVFRDVDNIPLGVDFREHINSILVQADITLVVVGKRWFGPLPRRRRRIDDPADPVRVEVETALRNGLPVVPVLVEGGAMPNVDQLPDSLREFVYRNGLEVDSGRDFDQHIERLIRSMEPILARRAKELEEPARQAEEEKRRAEAARQAEEEKRRAEAARQAEEEKRRAEVAAMGLQPSANSVTWARNKIQEWLAVMALAPALLFLVFVQEGGAHPVILNIFGVALFVSGGFFAVRFNKPWVPYVLSSVGLLLAASTWWSLFDFLEDNRNHDVYLAENIFLGMFALGVALHTPSNFLANRFEWRWLSLLLAVPFAYLTFVYSFVTPFSPYYGSYSYSPFHVLFALTFVIQSMAALLGAPSAVHVTPARNRCVR
jgi:hypothetical protein